AEKLLALHQRALDSAADRSALDTLDAADAEDALLEALEDLGVPEPWRIAEPLAAAGVDDAWLRELAELAGPATPKALTWCAATPSERSARSPPPARPSRNACTAGPSTRSSRRSRSARAPDWGSSRRAGSSSTATTARSRCSPSRGARHSACRCPSGAVDAGLHWAADNTQGGALPAHPSRRWFIAVVTVAA